MGMGRIGVGQTKRDRPWACGYRGRRLWDMRQGLWARGYGAVTVGMGLWLWGCGYGELSDNLPEKWGSRSFAPPSL